MGNRRKYKAERDLIIDAKKTFLVECMKYECDVCPHKVKTGDCFNAYVNSIFDMARESIEKDKYGQMCISIVEDENKSDGTCMYNVVADASYYDTLTPYQKDTLQKHLDTIIELMDSFDIENGQAEYIGDENENS